MDAATARVWPWVTPVSSGLEPDDEPGEDDDQDGRDGRPGERPGDDPVDLVQAIAQDRHGDRRRHRRVRQEHGDEGQAERVHAERERGECPDDCRCDDQDQRRDEPAVLKSDKTGRAPRAGQHGGEAHADENEHGHVQDVGRGDEVPERGLRGDGRRVPDEEVGSIAKRADIDERVERNRQGADDHAGDRQPADATGRSARQPALGEQ